MAIPKPVLHTLNIDLIQVSSTNPRLSAYAGEAFDTLVDTIKEHGIITPLTVNNIDKEYFLIAGERRYRAAKKAGVDDIPCIVHQNLSDEKILKMQVIENTGRVALTSLEEGLAIKNYMNKYPEVKKKDVAEAFGLERTRAHKVLKIIELPEAVWGFICSQKLSDGHAEAITRLIGEAKDEKIVEIATAAISLTVSETRDLVSDTLSPKDNTLAVKLDKTADRITAHFGGTVTVKRKGKDKVALSVELDNGSTISITSNTDNIEDTITLLGVAPEVSAFDRKFADATEFIPNESEIKDIEEEFAKLNLPYVDVSDIERHNEVAENTTTNKPETAIVIQDDENEAQTEAEFQVQTDNKVDENGAKDLSDDNVIEIDDFDEVDYSYIEDEDIEIADDLWDNIKFTNAKGHPLTDSNAVALLTDIKAGRLESVCSPYKYGPAIRHTYKYMGEDVCIDENENYGWLRTLSASLRKAEKQVKTNSRADTSAATESFLLGDNTITTETAIENSTTPDLYDFPHPISSFPCEDTYDYEAERKLIFKAINLKKGIDLSEPAIRELIHAIHTGAAKVINLSAKADGLKIKILNYKVIIEITHDPALFSWITQTVK